MNNNPFVVEIKNVTKGFDGHAVLRGIDLSVKRNEFLTLLGPSGCGKTTLLRIISGFEAPEEGRVFVESQDMTNVAPNLRHVHTVFQSYALFPHMTVYENVAFGLRCKKVPEAEIEQRVIEALTLVKLKEMMQRKPGSLSGGQQQRVAIARAIINKPLVLLLDEPFSSLDYRLRKAMRVELKQLQRQLGITFIFVTHDQEEALSMSDRIVVMENGKIEQIGTPLDVYEEPKNLSVAKFIGELNIFDGKVSAINADQMTVDFFNIQLHISNKRNLSLHQKAHILVRPEDMRVYHQNEEFESTFVLYGTVEEVIYKGTTVDLMIILDNQQRVSVTEFFDEEHEKLTYTTQERVKVTWVPGWEVVLPYEQE